MPSRGWGPWVVIAIYTLAGGLIGVDIALWPWDQPVSFQVPTAIGAVAGLLAGIIIVWVVRRAEESN